jgi:hypothetical protein
MDLTGVSKDAQRAFVGISEAFDNDPINRERALRAFEKSVVNRRPDIGLVFFGTLDDVARAKVRLVCAPYHVVLG